MQPTTKTNSKTVTTVLTVIILAISGFFVLMLAQAAPTPNGPVITSEKAHQ